MNQTVIYVVGFLTEPPQHEPGRDLCGGFLTEPPQHEPDRDLCGGFPYRATST